MDLRQIFREMAEGDFFSPPKLLQPQRSDLTSDFKSVTSITYIHIHVHIAYKTWTLLTALEALQPPNSLGGKKSDLRFEIRGPEVKYDLIFEIFGPNSIYYSNRVVEYRN